MNAIEKEMERLRPWLQLGTLVLALTVTVVVHDNNRLRDENKQLRLQLERVGR